MTPHSQNANDLLKSLGTDREKGLTLAAVAGLKEKYGENKLREKKKKTTAQRFIDQFKDAMILILIAAAIVSFVVICVEENWGRAF